MCKSCCATKDVEEFDGYKTCNKCREAKTKCYKRNRERNITKHVERKRQRGANYAKNADIS